KPIAKTAKLYQETPAGTTKTAAQAVGLQRGEERGDRLRIETAPSAAARIRRQHERAEAHAHQAAYRHAERFEHASHLAVASLAQHHLVPAVGPAPAARRNAVELRRTVVERDTAGELFHLLARKLAPHAHRVLALDLAAGVHEAIGQLARIGEQ